MSQACTNPGKPRTFKAQIEWNSTLYMVESILEQKMALAAYAAENNIAQLTPTQLEIAWRMALVLSPVEETKQRCKKVRGQSEAALQIGMYNQKC